MSRHRHDPHVYVALLAGGRGTRFWPLSRRDRPKQLLDLTGEGPLARATLDRVAALCPRENRLVVTTEDLAPALARLLGLPRENVIGEPGGRNTAPAVGLAALVARARDENAVVIALPSDHAIDRPAALRAALLKGIRAARQLDALVLFGEAAREPETQYGYIVPGPAVPVAGARRVARFREKPAPAVARRLVARGAFWNSGMSCFRASVLLDEIRRAQPALAAGLDRLAPHAGRRTFGAALRRIHPRLPSISLDHGVLERSDRVVVLPVELGWSDVGTWEALARRLAPDADGNRAMGAALFSGSNRCLALQRVPGSRRTLVVLGATDILVADAGDVVLVAPREAAKGVQALLAQLGRERPELL